MSIKASWSYLDLCGSTWSYIYNLSLAPLQARLVWWIRVTSPVESPSVYMLLVSPPQGHIPWESRSLLVPIRAQDPPMVILGPFQSGVFGTSSIIRGCFTYTLYSQASQRQAGSKYNRNSKIKTSSYSRMSHLQVFMVLAAISRAQS